jgi:hypothetical protein
VKTIKLKISDHYERIELGKILRSNDYDAWIESQNDVTKSVCVCVIVPDDEIVDTEP